MKIKEAKAFFEKILEHTKKKSHRKTYNIFWGLLNELEHKKLTDQAYLDIEEELFRLNLAVDIEDRPDYLKQRLREFKTYLKEAFGFVLYEYHKEEYTGYGMLIGMLLSFFIPALSFTFGFLFGMCIGSAIGEQRDKEAKKEGRVLDTRKNKKEASCKGWTLG
ncbi:MAG: hypothetical protein AAF696_09665 [Bacteroidota bacterium]